ncbi:MAG TPA: hypothetical protein VNA19_02430 [Pyrinomonadaceae bacterium]|nr:hypothetical protein [Pyrinomonadaceae bacterium]
MRKELLTRFVVALLLLSHLANAHAAYKSIEFGDVVKLIERHYGVKHKGIPALANMGLKASQMVARRLTRYAEYGSVKVAFFEDQDFTAPAGGLDFHAAMRTRLEPEWQPLVQVRTDRNAEQTYIYTKEAGKFFKIVVVSIGRRDATAVQLDIAPQKLMLLMRDPDAMGKTLTDDAAGDTEQ